MKTDVPLHRRMHFTCNAASNVEDDNKSLVQVDRPSFFLLLFFLWSFVLIFSILSRTAQNPDRERTEFFFIFIFFLPSSPYVPRGISVIGFLRERWKSPHCCTCIVCPAVTTGARARHCTESATARRRHAYVYIIIIALHRVHTVTCTQNWNFGIHVLFPSPPLSPLDVRPCNWH